MSREAIVTFIENNKPLRHLIELAVSQDKQALDYIEFIQEEINKKFKAVDDSDGALESSHLTMQIDPKDGQDGIRAVDENKIYYFNEYGVLKNEKDEPNELSFEQYEKLGAELTFFMFHILTTKYKFKPKVVGNQKIAKKKSNKKNDYKFKTILFSPGFEKCDSVVVMIPPVRGGVTYNSLAIDEGLSYGTMLPYIEKILSWNPKIGKKKKKGKKSNSFTAEEKEQDKKQKKPLRRWGIMILDPQGKDVNNNKYSIIKIYDKWLSKRIPSVGLFGGFHPKKAAEPTHRRTGSDESVSTTLSTGSDTRIKVDIKNLFFIGGLQNGELISHLLHRRGQSVEKVMKGCIFLASDDPYDANDVTKAIYERCGVNYLNSSLPRDTVIEGKKINGDPYIIKRLSAGNARYCCQSAFPSIIKFIEDGLIEKENGDVIKEQDEEEDEYKKD